jgi:ligand-binding sensor domain-containing protein
MHRIHKLLLIASIFSLTLGTSPKAGAQWVLTNSPLDGSVNVGTVTALAVSGTNLLAGCPDGAFLSENNGETWSAIDSGLKNNIVTCLAVIGTTFFAGTLNGLFRSTDSGKNWIEVTSGLPPDASITASEAVGSNFFIGTSYGVFLSTNDAVSWDSANSGLPYGDFVTAFALNDSNIFAGTYYNGVFLSTNNGKSWNSVSSRLTNDTITAMTISGANLFAGTNDSGVFLSTNNGTTWNAVNTGLNNLNIHSLASSGADVLLGNNLGVFLSNNNSIGWEADTTGMTGKQEFTTQVLSFAVGDQYVFAGCYAQVYRILISNLIPPAVVNESQTISSEIQTYPNPFSQSTTITFSSPESGAAEVTIVNLLGSQVARIFSGELDAGQHEFSWDASGMPPGMYECVVRMNGRVEQTPILLVH